MDPEDLLSLVYSRFCHAMTASDFDSGSPIPIHHGPWVLERENRCSGLCPMVLVLTSDIECLATSTTKQ